MSRNGTQGNLFRHPYDIAVAPGGGSLYVADMGEFASGSAPAADGRIIRVDPATGVQTPVSTGGELVDPAGVAVAPDGSLLVVENVGVGGDPRTPITQRPAVIRVNPRTGAQSVLARGAPMCYPFGIAVDRQGGILVSDFGNLVENGVTVASCDPTGGGVIRVNPSSGQQQWLSFNSAAFGSTFLGPVGLAVEPNGTVLVANQRSAAAAVTAVNPVTSVQQTVTPNSSPSDGFEQPQRVALAPDGNLVVSDYALNTLEGGLVSVVRSTGEARILRSGRALQQPARAGDRREPATRGNTQLPAEESRRRPAGELRCLGLERSRTPAASLRMGPGRQRLLRGRDRQPAADLHDVPVQHDPDSTRAGDRSARCDRRRPRHGVPHRRCHPPGGPAPERLGSTARGIVALGQGLRCLGPRASHRPRGAPALPGLRESPRVGRPAPSAARAPPAGPLCEPPEGAEGRPALHALARRGEPRPQRRPRAGKPPLLQPREQGGACRRGATAWWSWRPTAWATARGRSGCRSGWSRSGPPHNVSPETAAPEPPCGVLGRPGSAATRASCVLAWRPLGLAFPGKRCASAH